MKNYAITPIIVLLFSLVAHGQDSTSQLAEIRVGQNEGDIRGKTNQTLQAAVEYVSSLGGGTVHIGPGTYKMRNALTLRDNVRIIGIPGKSILTPVDGMKIPLATDGDCNQREITVKDDSGLQVGDRVLISCDRYPGYFLITAATLTAKLSKNRFQISDALRTDYQINKNARVELNVPCIAGWGVKNASVEGITIIGNKDRTECKAMDGCRHGGIYLFECEDIAIKNCVIRDFNGDGISFQLSHRVVIENCISNDNAGLGFHPGSGSQYPIIRNCKASGNESDGMFVCWRVQHGKFENNELIANKREGISIGHKDSDNLFRNNIVKNNIGIGLLFREESEPLGAHRNTFENNVFLDNGSGNGDTSPIVIRGTHNGLIFRGNQIGFSKPQKNAPAGVLTTPLSKNLDAQKNQFRNIKKPVQIQAAKSKD